MKDHPPQFRACLRTFGMGFDSPELQYLRDAFVYMAGFEEPIQHRQLWLHLDAVTAWTYGQLRQPEPAN